MESCKHMVSIIIASFAFILPSGLTTCRAAVESEPDQPPAAVVESPLDKTIRQMRDAGKHIEQGETGPETQSLQQDILKQLQALIEMAQKKPPASQQPQSGDPPPRPDQDSDSSDSPNNQQQNSESESQSSEDKTTEGTQDKQNPDDSTERRTTAESRDARIEEGRRLENDIWGHLPPSVREQVLNIFSEQYLPKYDDVIRRYFEALAEQHRRSGGAD